VVAAGLARECEVQLSYILGDEAPCSVEVDTFDSGVMDDARIADHIARAMDFRAGAIAERPRLGALPAERQGRFYRDLATGGHTGRTDMAAPWEVIEAADRLV
jgi:S-adenosylmethionine synthetase